MIEQIGETEIQFDVANGLSTRSINAEIAKVRARKRKSWIEIVKMQI